MSAQAEPLDELIKRLPSDRQDEVRDFVEFLLARQTGGTGSPDGAKPKGSARRFFGAWDSGDEHSADNERIDADLAREYGGTHEADSQ